MAARAALKPPCRPTPNDGFSPWPQPHRPCRVCGTPMRTAPMGATDWQAVALDGTYKGNSPDAPAVYLRDQKAWWDGIRDLMASKDPEVSNRAAQTYSTVQAYLGIYGIEPWAHIHRAQDAPPGGDAPGRRCPDCCGMPMHAQPRGWACRATGSVVPYAVDEEGPH